MSFLVPLYLAGLAAVSLPLLFHLIRRAPRGQISFSSLLFLRPSPPRLTRKSRVEHWLLLLLRAAALVLIALAFARPFLRRETSLDADAAVERLQAVLLDVSASMQRGDLWAQARRRVEEVLDEGRATDRVALWTFGHAVTAEVSFGDLEQLDAEGRTALVRGRLEALLPGWSATDLGGALVTAADALTGAAMAADAATRPALEVVLVSDLQEGSRLEALQTTEWPEEVRVDVRPVTLTEAGNAGIHFVGSAEADDPEGRRILVANAPDSAQGEFRLTWSDGAADRETGPAFHVPPGESRVVRAPPRPDRAVRLELDGDACTFDDVLWDVPPRGEELTVLHVGAPRDDEAADGESLHFYLTSLFGEEEGRSVQLVEELPAAVDPADVPLVIVSELPADETPEPWSRYLEAGGTVLVVLAEPVADSGAEPVEDTAPPGLAWLRALLAAPQLQLAEAPVRDYAMLSEIAFGHPLFAPFADPRFADFTAVHFWRYRAIEAPPELTALARFDSGDPFLLERRVAPGTVHLMASGWQPADSELGRSSKFPPLMLGMLRTTRRPGQSVASHYRVGEAVPLEEAGGGAVLGVRRPDGSEFQVASEAAAFEATDRPGIYELRFADRSIPFAVNLDAAESRTAPLDVAELEQRGARVGVPLEPGGPAERQAMGVELEGRQKLWRWLLAVALVVLVVETWLAGHFSRRRAEVVA